MACGQQKVKGGHGSIPASNSTSIIALISTSIHCIDHHPEPRSGLCPELLADFRIPKPPGRSQGARVGSLPRAWRRVGVPGAASVLKKFVRLASVFPSPPFRSSDFGGLRRPRLYGFHTGTRSLSNRKGRGRRSGGREREPRRAGEASPKPPPKPPPTSRSGLCSALLADFRIPKPPGCSQGARRAVFCAVRVADFLAEGAGWAASPGRGGELGCQALRRC